jgi:cyanate permease
MIFGVIALKFLDDRPEDASWLSKKERQALGNAGGLAGPPIIGAIKQETGSFTAALLFLAGALVLGGVVALLFGHAARTRAAASSPVMTREGR